MKDGATHANTIEGNRIGTDCTGKKSVPNGNAGIFVENARENVIKKNLISGNDASGRVDLTEQQQPQQFEIIEQSDRH